MLKKVLLTIGILLLSGGLGAGYIYHAGKAARSGEAQVVCKVIDISIQGSGNNLIGNQDIYDLIDGGRGIIGARADSVNLYEIEKRLGKCGEILGVEASMLADGTVRIAVRHRDAAARLMCDCGTFYSDRSGYLFPYRSHADVPVITGFIPLALGLRYQGEPFSAAERKWLHSLLEVTSYIESHDYWRRTISQIDVERNGDIVLYMNTGNVRFIFGSAQDIPEKFEKITKYYKYIAPTDTAGLYKSVNLKFNNQIVCKKEK